MGMKEEEYPQMPNFFDGDDSKQESPGKTIWILKTTIILVYRITANLLIDGSVY